MDFTLAHPDDPHLVARYGYDPERGGIWCEIEDGSVVVVEDATQQGSDTEWLLFNALFFLAEFGFFESDDAYDALMWLRTPPGCSPRRPRRGVRTALKVIRDLEAAGA